MTSLDTAYAQFLSISDEAVSNIQNIISEEDSKIQIITRIITECLGWQFSDISAERKHENGYSDYLISSSKKNCIIVEAKRIGRVPITLADRAVQKALKLNGPALAKCNEGIVQAASYAQPMGAPVALLTDGDTWIVFKPTVPGEDYQEKQSFVFPSLDSVKAKFSLFYELLSKESFSQKLYVRLFDELHNTRVLLSVPLVAPIPPTAIFRQQKSQLAFQLEPVLDSFFSRMTGEDDDELIVECFVETKESRIADHSLEKMTARVLGNISKDSKDLEAELSEFLAIIYLNGPSNFVSSPQ